MFRTDIVLAEILSLVLRAVYWLLMPAVLLRFYMQAIRMSFRNPLGQFVCAATDWIVKPLRRVIKGAGGYDWASLIAAVAVELLHSLLVDVLTARFSIFRGAAPVWIAGAAFGLVAAVLTVAFWCLFLYALLSWVRTDSPFGDLLESLVNPWLRPLRRRIPMMGGFDLSPLVLMVVLQIGLVILDHAQRNIIPLARLT